jgi:hypothetical protein
MTTTTTTSAMLMAPTSKSGIHAGYASRKPLRNKSFVIWSERYSTIHAQYSFATTSTRASTLLRSSSSGSTDDDMRENQTTTTTPLTPETIAEMIEVSFIQSCLQLSQGYIDVLKLFIVAVKAGYEISLSLHELHTLVTNCPVNSAGRDLMNEEKELRYEWMKLVYELLNALNQNAEMQSGDGVGAEGGSNADARISGVVKSMLSIQRTLLDEESSSGGKQDATVSLTNLTVDQARAKSNSLSVLYETTLNNPMERAILTNDIRVSILTFRVLQEERICLQDKSSGGMEERVPRPPIPGT